MRLSNRPLKIQSWIKSGLIISIFAISLCMTGCSTEEEVLDNIEIEEVEGTGDGVKDLVNMGKKPVLQELVYNFDEYEQITRVDTESYIKGDAIKGIYVSGYVAGLTKRMDDLLELADETEVNAFVINVKNDSGILCFDMDHPEGEELGAKKKVIADIDGLMDRLYEHDVYPIARIVAFKDPYLASHKPEYAIRNKDGSLWKYKGISWLNPYNKDVWKYIVDASKEAAKVGFKEIQFDYIRFEATRELENADFGETNGKTRKEIILEFIDYAMSELEPYGVKVSADVFGIVISSDVDAKRIGQDYIEMSKRLDVICPMVYPSHYGYGFFGIPAGQHSDLYPYETIFGSMEDSGEVLADMVAKGDTVVVRPWLQAFTASYLGSGNYMVYGKEAIREQIQATYDAGLSEWILWHAGIKYNKDALLPAVIDNTN